jgi:hypothetical protein
MATMRQDGVDRVPGQTVPDQRDRPGLTVADAAAHLGLSKTAVRRRIQRGTLPAEKGTDGEWLVFPPAGQTGTDRSSQRNSTQVSSEDRLRDEPGQADRDELVAQLRRENERLWDELRRVGEERDAERRRHDLLVAQLAENVKALSATTSRVQDVVETVAREVVPEPPDTSHSGEAPSGRLERLLRWFWPQ